MGSHGSKNPSMKGVVCSPELPSYVQCVDTLGVRINQAFFGHWDMAGTRMPAADNAFMEGERGLPGKYQPCLCALVRSDTVDSDTRWCQEYDALFCADSEKLLTYHRGNSYLISNQDCANEVCLWRTAGCATLAEADNEALDKCCKPPTNHQKLVEWLAVGRRWAIKVPSRLP
eukprot:2830739-Rhodomonas_salina.2